MDGLRESDLRVLIVVQRRFDRSQGGRRYWQTQIASVGGKPFTLPPQVFFRLPVLSVCLAQPVAGKLCLAGGSDAGEMGFSKDIIGRSQAPFGICLALIIGELLGLRLQGREFMA